MIVKNLTIKEIKKILKEILAKPTIWWDPFDRGRWNMLTKELKFRKRGMRGQPFSIPI